MSSGGGYIFLLIASFFLGVLFIAPASAQSVSQDFPTAVTSNEITGTIASRDIGDARLTTYFYTFDGSIGDLFVNVATRNFTGDIDVFAMPGLLPLTKIVVYADFAENETGRVLYFRKPEKLLLRVQGRTPGDEPAIFRIKFAGSFVAANESATKTEPELPKVSATEDTGTRVNSVGTIVEVVPKPKPVAKAQPEPEKVENAGERAEDRQPEKPAADKDSKPKTVVVITENSAKSETADSAGKTARRRVTPARAKSPPAGRRRADATNADAARVPPKAETPPAIDPLANIRLVIQFKDGRSIERPMNEVFRFSVDRGTLTVISKDGSIGRYSILDVEKVTIQ